MTDYANYELLGTEVIKQASKDFRAAYEKLVTKHYDYRSESFKAPSVAELNQKEEVRKDKLFLVIKDVAGFFCGEYIELYSNGAITRYDGEGCIKLLIKRSFEKLKAASEMECAA